MSGPFSPARHLHRHAVHRRTIRPDAPARQLPARLTAVEADPSTSRWIDSSVWWAIAGAVVALTGPIGVVPTLAAVLAGTVLASIGTVVILRRLRAAHTSEVHRSAGVTVAVTLALGFGTLFAMMPQIPPSA